MKILYDYPSSPSESSSGDVDDDVNFVVSSSSTAAAAAAAAAAVVSNTTATNNDLISVVGIDGVGNVNGGGESADSVAADGMATMVAPFETMRFIKIGLLAIMFILIFCGNVFVLIALNNRKLRKNRMYFFLVHLSIADLVTGFFNVLPQLAWEITRRFYGGNFLCKMVKFLQILGPYLSSYILVVTSIDRYQAICHPLSNHQNTRRSRWMVAIAWTLSFLYCTPQCFIFSYQKVSEDYYDCWATFPEPWMLKLYVTWYAISVFMVPFLILTWTHYFICREIWLNWHSKRQSLLVKPDLINKKTNNHHCNNNSSTITVGSNASGVVANKIDEMIGKTNAKPYSLSTSFGASVNNLIHRLSNSGLENKDDQQQQQSRSSMANSNHNSALSPHHLHHHHHHHHHHHLGNQSKSVYRRLLWFNRKSSSLSSSTTSSSDSPTSTMPPVDIYSGHLVQKCPFHQHKFRHHPSRHDIHRLDENDDDSHRKESTTKSVDEQIKALKHTKSESELLFRKQEKQLKRKRFLNGSIDSVVSIDEVFNHYDDQPQPLNGTINDDSRNLQPAAVTIRMAKSDRIVYNQDCSKYLDKRIKQWMIVKRHRPHPLPHSVQDRSNSDGVVRVPYGQPPKTAASSSLNCICCPQCCAYCHHYRSRSIESQTQELPYNQGSVYAKKSQTKPNPQRPISIMTNKNDSDFPSPKSSILVVPKDDFAVINQRSSIATTLKSNPNTVPSTPNTKCANTTISVSGGDTNNVVNVFVPRTYHINAGNKRMSNPRIHSMHGLTRAKIKTVKITLVVITCYVLCSTPFIFVQLWAQFWPNAQESPIYTGPVIAILMLLASLNSCVNPWIYIYFNPNLITLFCQFFKRKSSSEDPASKSCSLQNNAANNNGQLGVGHTKLRKKSTTESPECSLMSMNESYQTPPIQVDMFDLNKKRAQSPHRITGSKMANYHLNPTTMTTSTIMASCHMITSDSVSMNSLAQDLTDNSAGKIVDDPNQKPYHHRSSTDDSVDGESFSYTSSNKSKRISKSSNNSKKKRRHSISIHLDRMWAKLSLTKQYAQQQRQQQQQPQPIKSSRIRLYKAATMDVECVVDNDQYII